MIRRLRSAAVREYDSSPWIRCGDITVLNGSRLLWRLRSKGISWRRYFMLRYPLDFSLLFLVVHRIDVVLVEYEFD
jgi:hypothetical protein